MHIYIFLSTGGGDLSSCPLLPKPNHHANHAPCKRATHPAPAGCLEPCPSQNLSQPLPRRSPTLAALLPPAPEPRKSSQGADSRRTPLARVL